MGVPPNHFAKIRHWLRIETHGDDWDPPCLKPMEFWWLRDVEWWLIDYLIMEYYRLFWAWINLIICIYTNIYIYMGFLKWGIPKTAGFNTKFIWFWFWVICGYLYFRKPPYSIFEYYIPIYIYMIWIYVHLQESPQNGHLCILHNLQIYTSLPRQGLWPLAMIIIETTVVFLLPCLIEINYKITIFGICR